MSEHIATVRWERKTQDFSIKTYNREHLWDFGHGKTLEASAAPAYQGDPTCVDPEQAFVASLSSCHMLTFLAIASTKGFIIDRYVDHAVGILGKNAEGKMALTEVTLKPEISFSGDKRPDAAALHQLHEMAHKNCFIANSVTTKVNVD